MLQNFCNLTTIKFSDFCKFKNNWIFFQFDKIISILAKLNWFVIIFMLIILIKDPLQLKYENFMLAFGTSDAGLN